MTRIVCRKPATHLLVLLPERLQPRTCICERLAATNKEVARSVVEAKHRLHAINKTPVLGILDRSGGVTLHHVAALLCTGVFQFRLGHLGRVDLGTRLRLLCPDVVELLRSALEGGIGLFELLSLILLFA